MGELDGKTAIITGGAGNIGRACGRALAEAGANVVLADIDEAGAKRRAEEIADDGGSARGIGVDLRDDDSIRNMIQLTVDYFGGLHILHNNAAATRIAQTRDFGVEDMDMDAWEETMRVNLRAPLFASKCAIPVIRAGGGGSIINTTAGAGTVGILRPTAYVASKAGLNFLTKAIATQHGVDKIRCNAVSPGFTIWDDPKGEREGAIRYADRLLEQNLVARFGHPTDIANAVLFLASERSSFITGQILVVDGGSSAHGPGYAKPVKAPGAA